MLVPHGPKQNKKTRQRLRSQRGKPKSDAFNFGKIGLYSSRTNTRSFYCLPDQTLTAIDFDELFTFLDRTHSKVGQQVLFDKLRNPATILTPLNAFRNKRRILMTTVRKEKRQLAVKGYHLLPARFWSRLMPSVICLRSESSISQAAHRLIG